MEELLTVKEIAARLRVTEWTVRRWLREGKLKGRNFGGQRGYLVARTEVERFLRNGQEGERQP